MSRAMRQRRVALCALSAALLCLPDADAASAAPRKQDRTKPVVAFKAPTASTSVSGSLSGAACEASATDKYGVDRVEFSVDGAALNVDRAAPYNCAWDTTRAGSGQHTVTARAVDTSGNAATTGVTVSIVASEPTPAPTPIPTATPTATPTPTGDQFPSPASTGTPAGWEPSVTRSTDLTVTTDGALVQDTRFTDGANIIVRAKNVTIRRVEIQGGTVTNQYGSAPDGCATGLVVEDTTFEPIPGQPYVRGDGPRLGEGGWTARRVKMDHVGEGFRASDCGPVVLEDSFAYIVGDEDNCAGDFHSDGFQGYYAKGGTFTNNTLVLGRNQAPWALNGVCGTAAFWLPTGQGNQGTYTTDRLLVAGGGFTFRHLMPSPSITGLRVVDGSWAYGPLDVNCSTIGTWEAKRVTVDSAFKVTSVVGDLPCG